MTVKELFDQSKVTLVLAYPVMFSQLGKKDMILMRKVGFTGFFIGACFMGFSALLLILFKDMLPYLFIQDQNVIGITTGLILIAAFFQISDGLQVVGLGALRGMADVKIPTFITLISYWVLALPIGYVLGIYFNSGAKGVWIGLLTGLTLAAIMLLVRFNRISKHKGFAPYH